MSICAVIPRSYDVQTSPHPDYLEGEYHRIVTATPPIGLGGDVVQVGYRDYWCAESVIYWKTLLDIGNHKRLSANHLNLDCSDSWEPIRDDQAMIINISGPFSGNGHRLQTAGLSSEFWHCTLIKIIDDIGFTPREEQVEGGTWVQRIYFAGTEKHITALHWWDRQGDDDRYGHHVCAFAFGRHTAESVLIDCRAQHPWSIRVPVRLDLYAPPAARSGPGWSVGPAQPR